MPCRELGEISLTSLMGQPVEFRPKQVLGLLEILLQINSKESENIETYPDLKREITTMWAMQKV